MLVGSQLPLKDVVHSTITMILVIKQSTGTLQALAADLNRAFSCTAQVMLKHKQHGLETRSAKSNNISARFAAGIKVYELGSLPKREQKKSSKESPRASSKLA